ncbi:MAG: hypothetical protein ABW116_04495 [Candidatus Sedimenticola sp. 20ELBAFRAG]
MNSWRLTGLFAAMFCALTVSASELASVVRATELRSEPFRDATVLAGIQPRSSVLVTDRKGGWYQAKFGEYQGWVRMTALRFVQPGADGSSSGVEEAGSAFRFLTTGRSGYTGVTAATGIRGLDSADMMSAVPDRKAVDNLEWFKVEPAELKQFAADGGLSPRKVSYIKVGGGSWFSLPKSSAPQGSEKKDPFPNF